ncbi:hypothetical protein MKJ01_13070 [Chryseobacterium sp. SSA4.19]|uniref:hypothetical protein n=1 Tax=Chryseobacterium sp. SSA4.19 TaxID=2919915 RepID=UPI001F4EC03F|nr:hypothetical protein [Chryseobacterium sp. SSA4.19]MCJ8154696.1 hypothetical protein [Chryseobacterium sp. SSA4.19]
MNIISKFTVGSEEGIDRFLVLKQAHLNEIYDNLIDPLTLNTYIENELDRRTAINDLNDLRTQLIIVFDDEEALGYAMIRNTFNQPTVLEDKRAVCLSFFILSGYNTQEICLSLWHKCLSVTKNYSHWVELPANSALIPFFENVGFTLAGQSKLKPFNLSSQIMIRQNN